MINPSFTPIHLVKQSNLIVSVDIKQGKSIDQYDAVIREVLKGKTELKAIHLGQQRQGAVQGGCPGKGRHAEGGDQVRA
jgi:hypothetical protein